MATLTNLLWSACCARAGRLLWSQFHTCPQAQASTCLCLSRVMLVWHHATATLPLPDCGAKLWNPGCRPSVRRCSGGRFVPPRWCPVHARRVPERGADAGGRAAPWLRLPLRNQQKIPAGPSRRRVPVLQKVGCAAVLLSNEGRWVARRSMFSRGGHLPSSSTNRPNLQGCAGQV